MSTQAHYFKIGIFVVVATAMTVVAVIVLGGGALFQKTVRRTKHYHAHDENGAVKVGDTVTIEETAPISKLKRWRVVENGATA